MSQHKFKTMANTSKFQNFSFLFLPPCKRHTLNGLLLPSVVIVLSNENQTHLFE